jgi:predicted nucleic acid-binding protein
VIVLIDSNVPMYLVGTPHAHKIDAQRMIERHIAAGDRLVTDAEVFQEILHRYSSIQRVDAIQPAYDALLGVVDDVLPITQAEVLLAKDILLGAAAGISSRDALHVAVMRTHAIDSVMTFDRGFDRFPDVKRIGA